MVKTVADLNAEIDSQFPDNHSRSITPAAQRTVLKDIVTNIPVTTNQVLTDSGTPSGTTFLAGDNTWKPLSSAGAVTAGSIQTTGGTISSTTALYGDNTWKEPTVNVDHIATTSGTPTSSTILYGDNTWKTAPSGGGTTVTGGGLGFNFDSRAAASSASIATAGAGGPNWVRTNGYAAAGDGGGGLYVRVGTTPAYSNLIWFSSADGQKWTLVVTNEPLRLEQAGGGVSATASANSAAADAIHSIFYTNQSAYPSGYTYVGPNILLGYGQYNFAGPWFIKGGSNIRGLGSGMYGGRGTLLKFPAGSDGMVLGGPGGTNGRLLNPSLYGNDYNANGTIIRDLAIGGGWRLNVDIPYSANNATGMRGIGILAKCMCHLENLYISDFAEFGVYIKGTIGGGGSSVEPTPGTADNTDTSESYVCAQGNPNLFLFMNVSCENIGCDGFRDKGADANAGSYIKCSADLCYAWGYNSQCFLGNYFWGCHSATNGFRWLADGRLDTNSGKHPGAYQVWSDSNTANIVACYSEGGQPGSVFNGFSMVIGGLHAAGSPNQTPIAFRMFNTASGAFISPFFTPTGGGNVAIGQSNVDGEMINYNGQIFVRNEFGRLDTGTFGIPNAYSVSLSSFLQTMGRASGIGSGKFLMENGYWVGPGSGEADCRFRGLYDGFPTSGQFARGDHFDLLNPSAGGAFGYVCTTGGDYAGTPPVWKSKGNLAA